MARGKKKFVQPVEKAEPAKVEVQEVETQEVEAPAIIVPDSTEPVKASETLEVVADNLEVEDDTSIKTVSSGDEMVVIACCLSHGLEFDDVPNQYGGVKTVKFPSVNAHLFGKPEGILVESGRAVAVRIARRDWENIKRMHGRETAFVCNPPCLYEYRSVEDFNRDVDGVIKYMHNGLEAEDPKKLGVVEVERDK